MPNTADVAVIGGGVIGCSVAYYVAKLGIRCTVFEQRGFASGASGATAGVVGPLWHIPPSAEQTFSLGLRSLEMFPELAAELLEAGIDPEYRQSGILRVASTPEHADQLERDFAWQGELGLGVTWLTREEVLGREPEVSEAVLAGVYSPREGYVRGRRWVDSLVHAASRLGATFFQGVEVSGLETDGRRVTGVRTSRGTVYAEHTVIAAGPWTGMAGRWLPDRLPVRPVKGQRILLRKPGFLPKCPVHNFDGYVMPQPDGTVLVAATRHEGEFDQETTADAVSQMIARAALSFPTLGNAVFVGAQAGVRPGSPDGVPIIGPVPGWEGLSVASGHNSVGVILSPGTGQLIADYIDSGDAGPLEPFGLARFAGE